MTITGGVIWLFRAAIEHRRWQRTMRAQTDLDSKLIDRFSSSEIYRRICNHRLAEH